MSRLRRKRPTSRPSTASLQAGRAWAPRGTRPPVRLLISSLLSLRLLAAQVAPSPPAEVEGQIVQVTIDGAYANVGSEAGLGVGDRGLLMRGVGLIGSAEVISVSGQSALLRFQDRGAGEGPRVGDRVVFERETSETLTPETSPSRAPSPTLREDRSDQESFTPLLAPTQSKTARVSEPANLFHGLAWVRQVSQAEPESLLDYSITRVGTRGSLDRMGGSPWASAWDAEVSYRDGAGLRRSEYYQEMRVDVRELSLFRRFEDRSFMRLGRFLPMELPSAGYLDGGQGEHALSDHLRLGALLGLKPDRLDLAPSAEEPTLVPYLTLDGGDPRRTYYSGTLGLLASLYQGEPDRLAMLFDQRANLGPRLSLFSSLEADVDVGAALVRDGITLTRWNLQAYSPITTFLNVRAGLDHYQSPDTQAERDSRAVDPAFYLDNGYWRYWAGSSQRLPWNLDLSEDVSFTQSTDDDFPARWRLGVGRTGLFGLKSGRISLTAYNLEGGTVKGYGGRLNAFLPFLASRLTLQPSMGLRLFDGQESSTDFDLTDLALRADWLISAAWRLDAGVSHSFGESVRATLLDLGLQYRW